MDIDFHYHATYVAARFAGFSASEAETIGSAAQMIDENSNHVLIKEKKDRSDWTGAGSTTADEFHIRDAADGPTLHKYRVQMTFTAVMDTGTSSDEYVSRLWSVFHFLPGNYEVPHSLHASEDDPSGAPLRIEKFSDAGERPHVSSRWIKRTFSGAGADDDTPDKFRRICRPHSPTAIGIARNAASFFCDPNSAASLGGFGLHLLGVTMHVFADTWAHQDFMGPASKAINGIGERVRTGFFPSATTNEWPSLIGQEDPSKYAKIVKFTDSDWRGTAHVRVPAFLQLGENKAAFRGHGQVGHWPDHSALVWDYAPKWSSTSYIRVNPVVFLDAFVHMTWALYCAKNGLRYYPFDLTAANIARFCGQLGISEAQLRAVYVLLAKARDQWTAGDATDFPEDVTDDFDRQIFIHGHDWRNAMIKEIGLDYAPPVWIPGRPQWLLDAHAAYKTAEGESDKKQWLRSSDFMRLDFFKFNVATKLHFAFVHQFLTLFDVAFISATDVGSHYADDFGLVRLGSNEKPIVEAVQDIARMQRHTKNINLAIGLKVLLDEISTGLDTRKTRAGRLAMALDKLRNASDAVETRSGWSYGMLGTYDPSVPSGFEGKDSEATYKLICEHVAKLETLGEARWGDGEESTYVEVQLMGREDARLPTVDTWKSNTRPFLSMRSSDAKLIMIDNAYRWLLSQVGGLRTFDRKNAEVQRAGELFVDCCDDWLAANKSSSGRREYIEKMRGVVAIQAPSSSDD